jgi:hypothetical protein
MSARVIQKKNAKLKKKYKKIKFYLNKNQKNKFYNQLKKKI